MNMLKQETDKIKDKPYKLFISHSSRDKEYVELFVELLEAFGVEEDKIFCSSIPPYCIPLENKIYDCLEKEFRQSRLHVIYMFSENYYASAACLNEMGAAWIMKYKWTGILLPGFRFDQLNGCIEKNQINIKLDDSNKRLLKYRLGEFKDEVIGEFECPLMSESKWERMRDRFLERIDFFRGNESVGRKTGSFIRI